MDSYIGVQTAGDVFRNAARLYLGHFRVFFLAYFIPMAPVTLLLEMTMPDSWWRVVPDLVSASVMAIPVTAIISDICLGNTPGVRRAYRHVLGRMSGNLLAATLLNWLLTMLGLVLVIVPGLIIMMRLLIVAPVLVLERRPAIAAFRRSAQLGRGHYTRNLLIAGAAIGLGTLGTLMVQGILHFLFVEFADLPPKLPESLAQTVALVFGPYSSAVIVLVYYDMRARKEAFDAVKLAENLHR